MATTNIQAFSGDVEISSNLAVNTDDLFVDTVNSRVGIRTTSPGNTLEVAGTASVAILKSAADAATSTYNSILNGPRPGTTSSGAIHFINGSTRTSDGGASTYTIRNDSGALRLGNVSYNTLIDGNVGIGTTTMTEKLTVNGNIDLTPVYGVDTANKSGMIIFNKPITESIDTSTNIDSIYFDDSTNTYHFTQDTTKYATGNANIQCGTITGTLSNNLSPGSYLTGNAYNGSTARTFNVDATTAATASKIVARDSNGDIFARYLRGEYVNISHSTGTNNSDTIFYSSTDAYIRKNTASGFRSSLGLANSATITATSANTANQICQRNGSGDIFCRLFRSEYQNQNDCQGALAFRNSTNDNYIRFCSNTGSIRSFLGLANSATITADTVHGGSTLVQRNSSGHIYVNTVYVGASTSRGIRGVGGQYGTVQTTGGGASNWEGYSVDGRWVFMSDDGTNAGIYNDIDNEWAIYCTRNSKVSLYHNGSEKARTESTGLYMLGTPEMDAFIRHRGDNDCFMGFGSTDRWGVWTSGSERLNVPSTGGLYIYGAESNLNFGSGNRGYFRGGITTDPPALDFGLYVQYYIRSRGHVSYSDRRIKSNIVDINDTYALDQLRGLQPKYYNYVDTKGSGDESVIGFIAQEVKEVVPRAVSILDGEVPNIYTHANITSNNTVTFTDFNTSNLESNATTIIAYDRGTVRKELEIAEIVDEHTIRFTDDISDLGCSFDENGNVITVTETITLTPEEYTEAGAPSDCTSNVIGYRSSSNVVSIEEYELLTVKATYSPVIDFYTRVVTTYPGTEIFIWGQIVNDFHHLNKDYLWTIGTAALQEVDRQQQADKLRISELETQVASVLTRLDALESA